MSQKNIIVAISGASGAIYGVKILETLKSLNITTHLVITKSAKISILHETDYQFDDVIKIADHYYNNSDIAASIASGSFLHDGMIIAPCSVKTMSEIALGITGSLTSRAADVSLKERRKLVLLFRETPFNLSHIKRMEEITLMGGIVMPAVTSFYAKPKSVEDIVMHTVARSLDVLNIQHNLIKRWNGL